MKIKFYPRIFFLFLFAVSLTVLILFYFHLKNNSSTTIETSPPEVDEESPIVKESPSEDQSAPIKASSFNLTKPTSVFIKTLKELQNGEIIEEKTGTTISIAPNNSILNFIETISTLFTLVDLSGTDKLPLNFSWKTDVCS